MGIRTAIFLFIVATASSFPAMAGKKNKKMIKQLQADITLLASDSLEGRRTGTAGETKAGNYIENRYKELGIPAYKNQYRYPFHFTYGREIGQTTKIRLNSKVVKIGDEGFPLPFSAPGASSSDVMPEVTEQGAIWMVPLYKDKDEADNPHFEADKYMYDYAKEAKRGGAKGVIFFDSYNSKYEPSFNKHSEYDPLEIPVACLKYDGYMKYILPIQDGTGTRASLAVELNISIKKTDRTGTNIAAYVDNGAPYTVIVGAHYDHLGFGEDGNSLHANAAKEHEIHHGADDNASGTAALMEVAHWVSNSKLHNYNYLFIHFSGEELGLYGSKAFVKDQKIDSSKIAYMLNMDMVGRLNDSTRALTIGGVGTSPVWADVVTMGEKRKFKMVLDSAGVGPSDHTSFYYAGIPVLFFFTGTHKDYHKPSDRAEFINYTGEAEVIDYAEAVLTKMDKENVKPAYLVTKSATAGRSKFKVTLGIMPDYSYQDGGVRVDGVTDNRPAAKAGVKTGDIIIQLGDVKILSMQSYMEALGKFAPGDKTEVKLKRDGKEISLPIELMGK